MTEPMEWDFPPTMRPRRKPRIETVEILPPRQPERTVRLDVNVRHRSSGINPQHVVIAVALFILLLVLFRSPGGLLMLAVLVPPVIWLAMAVTVAVLVIANIRNHRSGKPF